MLIVKVIPGEPIERALKKLKFKFVSTKVLNELRERQYYEKKSIVRRDEIKKAQYVQKKKEEELGK